MTRHFTDVDTRALRDLIEDGPRDIMVRLDPSGFIIYACDNADQLGIDLSTLLLMPHISDLAEPEFVAPVADYALAAMAGGGIAPHIEFPLAARPDEGDDKPRPRWFSLSLRPANDSDEAEQGGIGVLRSVEHKQAVAPEWGAHSSTDPITGLANRKSFCGALARTLCRQSIAPQRGSPTASGDTMAIFAIDRMQAIFMQYGEATTEEIRWGFSRFLETMTHAGQILAQWDEERFAVLLPGMSMAAAREWSEDVLQTFAGLTSDGSSRSRELTASAGLARVELSVDWTLRQAELGLVMARAGGGMRVGVCKPTRRLTNGAAVERAMQEAVKRASSRKQPF